MHFQSNVSVCLPWGVFSMFCCCLYWSARAAVTKYFRLDDLNKRFVSHCSGGLEVSHQDAGKADFTLRTPLGSWVPTWLLCAHMASLCSWLGRERPSGLSGVSYKDTNFIMRAPPSWPHLSPVTSQRPISKYHHSLG